MCRRSLVPFFPVPVVIIADVALTLIMLYLLIFTGPVLVLL